MNNRIVALAGAVVLSLLTSVTLGAEREIGEYLATYPVVLKPIKGELKNQNACPGERTKFLKNVGPSLTNGSGDTCPIGSPGGFSETFIIDGTEVTILLCWRDDNSVDFKVEGGRAHLVGVTSNTNDLLYPYASFTSGPVFSDGQLNNISEAADVNHTDWCVEPVETNLPVVGEISIDPSLDGTTVSRPGPITISATVTDESDLQSVDIAIVSVSTNPDGSPVFTVPAGAITALSPTGDVYTWSLDLDPSFMIPDGDYTISITATDVFLNISLTSTKVITILPPNTSLAEGCLEIGAPPSETEDPNGGCNNSGVQNYLLPDVLADRLAGRTVEQKLAKAKLSAQNKYCGLDENGTQVVSEFVAWDPRVNPVTGELWSPDETPPPDLSNAIKPSVDPDTGEIIYPQLDLSTIFDLTDYLGAGVDPVTADRPLCPHCVGSPCLAVVTGKNSFQFQDLGLRSNQYPDGPVATATQFPTRVQGLNRFPWIGALSDDQPDLRFVPQAAYLPTYLDGKAIIPEQEGRQWTYEQWNPSRTKAVWDSLYPIGTVAACPGIDPSVIPPRQFDPVTGDPLPYVLAPETLPYFEAVQQCHVDLAVEYYDFLEETLILSEGTLINPSLNELLSIVNQVRSMLRTGQCRKAESDLDALLQAILAADFTLTTENYPGQAVMRILNLKHRNTLNCEAQARLDAVAKRSGR